MNFSDIGTKIRNLHAVTADTTQSGKKINVSAVEMKKHYFL